MMRTSGTRCQNENENRLSCKEWVPSLIRSSIGAEDVHAFVADERKRMHYITDKSMHIGNSSILVLPTKADFRQFHLQHVEPQHAHGGFSPDEHEQLAVGIGEADAIDRPAFRGQRERQFIRCPAALPQSNRPVLGGCNEQARIAIENHRSDLFGMSCEISDSISRWNDHDSHMPAQRTDSRQGFIVAECQRTNRVIL